MINKSELLERFIKLLWVDDETLVNAENLNRLEDFIDILDLRTRTQVGDVIENSTYSTMQEVINRYGGEFWIKLSEPNPTLGRMFYTWIRSDVDPTTTELKSYEGMAIITDCDSFKTEEDVKKKYGGNSWQHVMLGDKNDLLNRGAYNIWLCTSHDSLKDEEKLPTLEGLITFSTLNENNLAKQYKDSCEWKKVDGFEMTINDKTIYQYICTKCIARVLTGLGSCVGMLSLSSNLNKEEEVKEVYDATILATTNWSGYTNYALKQWIRNA